MTSKKNDSAKPATTSAEVTPAKDNPGHRTDAELEGRATTGGREKTDGASGPRPRVEWTDDGTPRPEGSPAKVTDPRGTEEEERQRTEADSTPRDTDGK
jgi:hypothetical protein